MFDLIWAAGKQNAADYFTKHHKIMRRIYLQQVAYHVTLLTDQYSQYVNSVRGCVTLVTPARTARTSFPCQQSLLVLAHSNMAVALLIQT